MINKTDKIAIVGASNNPRKYGNLVMGDLISKGYNVVPINPSERSILEIPAYKDLKSAGKGIDLVLFIVPPAITEKILIDVKKMKIPRVWMQPGSESPATIKFCEENKIECVHDSCIMLQ